MKCRVCPGTMERKRIQNDAVDVLFLACNLCKGADIVELEFTNPPARAYNKDEKCES